VLVLVAGVPLFLCMPPWNDVTLHDMVARTILRGGVLYRDVFDTNLPGIDWCMALIRGLFGWSYEVLRAVDLLVIGAAVFVLCGWVRRCGATQYAVAWFVAAAALFYPFLSEFCHVQRDPWMMLPAVIAARLRFGRVTRGVEGPVPSVVSAAQATQLGVLRTDPPRTSAGATSGQDARGPRTDSPLPAQRGDRGEPAGGSPQPTEGGRGFFGRLLGSSIPEGFVWGLAVWVKPHVVVPALAVWALSAVLLVRREPVKRIGTDLGGLILGGLCAGAPGVLWLLGTGAWPYFLDVFLNWNPDYLSDAGSLWGRYGTVFHCARPWSNIQFVALPLALLALWEVRVWSRRPGPPARIPGRGWLYTPAASETESAARALLAVCYLGWIAQVVLVQKSFDYVHVPVTFLGLALLAAQRWCVGFVYLMWFITVGALVNVAEVSPPVADVVDAINPQVGTSIRLHVALEKHPLADGQVVGLWPRCWTEGSSPELRDRLGQYTDVHCGTRWRELETVADYLRTVDPPLGPGELNCWHDSTHPLYLMLDLDPATRYMHYGTAFGIKSKRPVIADEVAASRQRYVVSDLVRTRWDKLAPYQSDSWRAGDPLPVWLPPAERAKFPWNQPVVFRSGRYLVHKIDPTRPLGTVRVPDWTQLDRLATAEPDE
jgi:hypothetical protein